MYTTKLFTAALLLVGSAVAQTMTGDAPGAQETVHVVEVGLNGGLTFSPNNVKANVGDLVQFQFWPKNHSVVQSTFAQPCVPIQNSQPNVTTAFFSGFMPNKRTTSGPGSGTLTYTIRVTTDKPIWYYCSQGKHCQSGMVGAINALTTGEKTIEAFAGLAAQAPANISPGQPGGGAGNPTDPNNPSNPTNPNNPNNPIYPSNSTIPPASTLATFTNDGGLGSPTETGLPPQSSGNSASGKLLDSARSGMVGIAGAAIAFFLL